MVECWPFLLIKIRPRSFLKVECESERVRWPFCFVFQEPSRTFLYRSGQPSGGTKLSHEAMLMVTKFVGLNGPKPNGPKFWGLKRVWVAIKPKSNITWPNQFFKVNKVG